MGEMPHLIAGELPCTYFCVIYVEIGDLVFSEVLCDVESAKHSTF
jgi:hypothetical protein